MWGGDITIGMTSILITTVRGGKGVGSGKSILIGCYVGPLRRCSGVDGAIELGEGWSPCGGELAPSNLIRIGRELQL